MRSSSAGGMESASHFSMKPEMSACTRARVVAIPASVFFHDRDAGRGIVRFVFCKRLETLREAGRRLLADPFLVGR